MFYSIMVLKSITMKDPGDKAPAHDYLDDLEGFLWVYIFLIFTFKANGERRILKGDSVAEKHIKAWSDVSIAEDGKFTFLGRKSRLLDVIRAMDASWPKACTDLAVEFRQFMWPLVSAKDDLLKIEMAANENGDIPNRFSDVLSKVDSHYDCILDLFDVALKKLEEEEAVEQVATVGNSRPPWPPAVAESSTTGSGTTSGSSMAVLPPPPPGPPPAQSPIHRTRSRTGKRTSRDVLSEEEVSKPKRRRQQALPGSD
jgi:hypothetical protein